MSHNPHPLTTRQRKKPKVAVFCFFYVCCCCMLSIRRLSLSLSFPCRHPKQPMQPMHVHIMSLKGYIADCQQQLFVGFILSVSCADAMTWYHSLLHVCYTSSFCFLRCGGRTRGFDFLIFLLYRTGLFLVKKRVRHDAHAVRIYMHTYTQKCAISVSSAFSNFWSVPVVAALEERLINLQPDRAGYKTQSHVTTTTTDRNNNMRHSHRYLFLSLSLSPVLFLFCSVSQT